MSDEPGPDTEVRLSTDLLDLRKRASRSSTEYPVFEYRVDYRGSPPGELRLTESLPAAVDPDDVEFHPDFHGDNWTCDDGVVAFEYILPDAEVVETKFGLSVDDPAVAEALLTGPEVVVDDLETGERLAAYDPDDAAVVAPDPGEGMPPVEPDPVSDTVREIVLGEAPVDEASSPADVEQPIAATPPGDAGDAADSDDDGGAASEPTSARPGDSTAEGVGAALAAELRAGEIPEDDLAVLREHLDVASGVSESERVRLRDLQARYHDLAAYTDALEAFVDEHGNADGILADLESDLAALESRVDDLAAASERVAGALEDAEASLEGRLDEHDERLARVETAVADLEEGTEVLLELQDVFGSN